MKKISLVIILFLSIFIITGCEKEKEIESNQQIPVEINLIKDKDVEKSIFKSGYEEARKIVDEMTLEEKIGQLFLVRYNKYDVDAQSAYNPGGYILFAKDFDGHVKATITDEIESAQNKNKYPLVIAVDEEGGTVVRISRNPSLRNERFLAPRDYYNQGGYELLENIEKEKATLLKELGVNLNLAPVADVSTNSNDFIYNRSFRDTAQNTSTYVKNMVKYANDNKINSCLKHFPGYGNNVDTHTGVAIDNRTYESINTNDYLPFKAGIKAGVPTILVSHNVVKAIDENYPASLSKNVINELRNKLKFSGIIMTDDLAMDAVKSYVENGEAATLAINAGNDMIITSDFINMYNEVLMSVQNNKISEDTFNKAVLRIIAWKNYSKLF